MRIVGIVVGSLLLVVLAFGLWFNNILNSPTKAATAQNVTVVKGDGVKEVADKLFEAGYLQARWHWNFYIVISGLRSSLLDGSYALTPTMSLRDVAKRMTTPVLEDKEVAVKLLEGWTAPEMAVALEKAGVINQNDFLNGVAVTDSRLIVTNKTYGFLIDKPATATMEGFLFPDTYRFFKGSTPSQVLEKLLDNFELKLTTDLRRSITAAHRTIYATIILASILEEELRTDRDRALAADLFLRRMEAGIPLQSDATVNFVTGKRRTQASLEDTQIDSPYNTYQHQGLPPGPIGNPGMSAIRAAVTPEANQYLYFLTAPDGKTHFAVSYEEHLQNKARYLK